MDVDVLISARGPDWDRLDQLLHRGSSLTGAEADELIALYQRVSTDLSLVRSAAPDPALVARLSSLTARARSAVVGIHSPAWREFLVFFTQGLPAALYRARYWWVSVGLAFCAVAALVGVWVATHPEVQASVATAEEIKQLTQPGGDFETYYSSEPAAAFAANVWTNNALLTFAALILGVSIVPVILLIWANAQSLGVAGGLMAEAGRLDAFFGLITPHGLLELTALFVATGAGLRLGWAWVEAGRSRRTERLAMEGRVIVTIALGLGCVLLLTGVIEAFVTPSGLPTWARVGIGVAVELGFLAYVFILGRRAVLAGETGDLDHSVVGDALPSAG